MTLGCLVRIAHFIFAVDQLQHPILKALEGSSFEWLKDLLFVFNAGDLGKYDTLQSRLQEEVCLNEWRLLMD